MALRHKKRSNFVTWLLLVLPVFLFIIILWWAFNKLLWWAGKIVQMLPQSFVWLFWKSEILVHILCLVLLFWIIWLLGLIVNRWKIGQRIKNGLTSIISRVPILRSLSKITNPEKYFLVIFGPVSDVFTSRINIPFFSSGYISNPNILSAIYSCCDVIINPSLIENLPTTCLESICCGVPVVAFDVGGTSDIVVHKETGYLATPYKSEEIIEGIEWCLNNLEKLSKNCVSKSLTDFDTQKTIEKTIELYSSIIK